ncbi:MAG: HEPN domain-containing protein [Deltaproteobacteria bacterium]|nr:HEPN domain-containing protein [Deltaproteobacteria bacterium]
MQDERYDPGSPKDWLRRAKSNLIRAKQPKHEEVFWEDLCFDAQQAAEKSLKALLVHKKIPFRLVHDIAELLTVLKQNGIALPEEIQAAAELSDYAVAARYPGPIESVTKNEYNDALRIAEKVVAWVEGLIGSTSERTTDN